MVTQIPVYAARVTDLELVLDGLVSRGCRPNRYSMGNNLLVYLHGMHITMRLPTLISAF